MVIEKAVKAIDKTPDKDVLSSEGDYSFGRMKISGYKVRILSGHEAGKESIISKADAVKISPEIALEEKEPLQMTSREYNTRFPKLKEMTEGEKRAILTKVNKSNKEEAGVDEPIPYGMFSKDFEDVRWNKETGEIMQYEHKELVADAVRNHVEIPEQVKAEYSELIAEIEAKRAAAKAARDKKDAARKAAKRPEELGKREKSEIRPKVSTRGGQVVSRRPHKAEKAGSTPAPATKPKEREKKGLAFAELEKIHERRTARAKAADEAKRNVVTLQPENPRVKRWRKDPGSADVSGIDTKNKVVYKWFCLLMVENKYLGGKAKWGRVLQSGKKNQG